MDNLDISPTLPKPNYSFSSEMNRNAYRTEQYNKQVVMPEDYSWHREDPDMLHIVKDGVSLPYYRDVLPLHDLLSRKKLYGLHIIIVIPTWNEEKNIGKTLDNLQILKMVGLVDAIEVYDSNSTDNTRKEVMKRDIPFHKTQTVLRNLGYDEDIRGKGANLWASVLDHMSPQDILVFCDADFGAKPSQIQALISPLLEDPPNPEQGKIGTQLSLAIFKRLTQQGKKDGVYKQGGRITESLIKPVLYKMFPQLKGIMQPIAGLYAVRGSTLADCQFPIDYGIETRILAHVISQFGPTAFAQVYCGTKAQKGHQDLKDMAAQIIDEMYKVGEEYLTYLDEALEEIFQRGYVYMTYKDRIEEINGLNVLIYQETKGECVDLPPYSQMQRKRIHLPSPKFVKHTALAASIS